MTIIKSQGIHIKKEKLETIYPLTQTLKRIDKNLKGKTNSIKNILQEIQNRGGIAYCPIKYTKHEPQKHNKIFLKKYKTIQKPSTISLEIEFEAFDPQNLPDTQLGELLEKKLRQERNTKISQIYKAVNTLLIKIAEEEMKKIPPKPNTIAIHNIHGVCYAFTYKYNPETREEFWDLVSQDPIDQAIYS